jgi:hypothetical protein
LNIAGVLQTRYNLLPENGPTHLLQFHESEKSLILRRFLRYLSPTCRQFVLSPHVGTRQVENRDIQVLPLDNC